MPDVSVATTFTFTASNLVGGTINPVVEVDSAGQMFDPTFGFRISDPLILPGTPVTGSVVRWTANIPAGTTVTVLTSINSGASWDVATNNRPVPRLRPGNTVTRSVLTKVILTRPSAFVQAPTVTFLELEVSCDAAVDELVDVGFVVIDKANPKTTTGTGGGGSGGGGGVISHGGGQTGGGTSIKLHGVDLSRSMKLAEWEQPLFIPTDITYGDACRIMVQDRLPFLTEFNIASTEHIVDDLIVFGLNPGADPWQDVQELAQAVGCEVFFDPAGVFVFRPVPDPRYGEPVWTITEDANPVFTEIDKELNDDPVRNFIIVKGESTSTQNPVSAYAYDGDPNSPTYIGGKLGIRSKTVTIQSITTKEMAQAAANGILYNSLGLADQVTITIVPNPALEPGDIVKVKISDVKANGMYLINRIDPTPMSQADSQQLVCYRQTANIAA